MDVLARELRSLPGAADASARDAQRESAPFPA
jgi:hypothetical protein